MDAFVDLFREALERALEYSHYSTLGGPPICNGLDSLQLIEALQQNYGFSVFALENKEEASARGVHMITAALWLDTMRRSFSCHGLICRNRPRVQAY